MTVNSTTAASLYKLSPFIILTFIHRYKQSVSYNVSFNFSNFTNFSVCCNMIFPGKLVDDNKITYFQPSVLKSVLCALQFMWKNSAKPQVFSPRFTNWPPPPFPLHISMHDLLHDEPSIHVQIVHSTCGAKRKDKESIGQVFVFKKGWCGWFMKNYYWTLWLKLYKRQMHYRHRL